MPPSPEREVTVEELAQFLEEQDYLQLWQKLSNLSLPSAEFERFFLELRSESDRALAIVAFSYIDEMLEQLFQRALNPEIVGGVTGLFDSFGPLSTANARIELAAALYWIEPRTYHSLRILRRIRNTFAHEPFASSFEDARVASLLSSLVPLEQPLFEAMPNAFEPLERISKRVLYHVRAALTCHNLMAQLATAPSAQRLGMPPHAALRKGFDAQPTALKELDRALASIVIGLIGSPGTRARNAKRDLGAQGDH